jgi:RNA polymerase sigma factor (sigma-70 family)
MGIYAFGSVLENLRQVVAPEPEDGELLRTFLDGANQAAFEILVRRHGPMVLRLCRRFLGNVSDAEDAFQATFLLLARQARSIRNSRSLGSWLHGVAYRMASNIHRATSRRRRHEQRAVSSEPTDPVVSASCREIQAVLEQEIEALPDSYREPFILCCLENLSSAEAANRLGLTEAAVRNRLTRARKRLRAQLARRGVSLVAALALVSLSTDDVLGAVSRQLLSSTTQAGVAIVSQAPLTDLLVSPRVIELVEEGAKAVVFTKSIVLALFLVTIMVVGSGILFPFLPELFAQPTRNEKKESKTEGNETTTTIHAPVDRLGDPLPQGAVARLGTRRLFGPHRPRWSAFSPDGTKLATLGDYGVTVHDVTTGRQLVEREHYWPKGNAIGWRADGTGVALVQLLDDTYFISAFTDPKEELPEHLGNWNPGFYFFSFSPDATRLAVVPDPKKKQFTVDIFPTTPGKRISELKPLQTLGPFVGPCREIRYTTRGLFFLTGPLDKEGDWTISIVDPDKNAIVQTVTIPHPTYSMWGFMHSLSVDARLAAIPPRPKTDENGKSTTGRSTADRSDGTIRIWDLQAGKELQSIPFPKGAGIRHSLTPDGKKLIASGDKTYFQIWDVATGKEIARSPQPRDSYHDWNASAIAVSPDGKKFATARQDGRIDLWDTASGKPLIPLDTHRKPIIAVSVSPNSQLVATLGQDATLRVWELATGKLGSTIRAPGTEFTWSYSGPHRRLAFTPDGRGLLFQSGEELTLVDPLTGNPLDLPNELRGYKATVGGFSADGKTLTLFDKDAVTLHDWPNGKLRQTITLKQPKFDKVRYSASLSPDARFLFTYSVGEWMDVQGGSSQRIIDLWDAQTGKQLPLLSIPNSWHPTGCFTPDGRVLYMGGYSSHLNDKKRTLADALTMWDPLKGKFLRQLVEPPMPQSGEPDRAVGILAISANGRLLATFERVNMVYETVWIYETASGRPLKKLVGHDRQVNGLAFSPDSRRLVSVGEDQIGLVWDVTIPELANQQGGRPTDKELIHAWNRLGETDPTIGYQGIATLLADSTNALNLLKENLLPAPVPTNDELDNLIQQLSANRFTEREKASKELERFGPNAVAGVKSRLATTTSQEVRDRLKRFLDAYDGPNPSPYELRCIRGVIALESIRIPKAKELLAELAKGKADDVLTREALTALPRMRGR